MTREAIHPGETLRDDLEALGMSAAELAQWIEVPVDRIMQILNCQRAITGEMAELATSAGLPHPEIEECRDCVTVRFQRDGHQSLPHTERDLTEQQGMVLALLRDSNGVLALREILPMLAQETTARQLREDLAILKSKRLIELNGRGRGARWRAT